MPVGTATQTNLRPIPQTQTATKTPASQGTKTQANPLSAISGFTAAPTEAERLSEFLGTIPATTRFSREDTVNVLEAAAVAHARQQTRQFAAENPGQDNSDANDTINTSSSEDAMTPREFGANLIGMATLLDIPLPEVERALRDRNPNLNRIESAIVKTAAGVSEDVRRQQFRRKTMARMAQFQGEFIQALSERGGYFGKIKAIHATMEPNGEYSKKIKNLSDWEFFNLASNESAIRFEIHRMAPMLPLISVKKHLSFYIQTIPFSGQPMKSVHIHVHTPVALMSIQELIPQLKEKYPDFECHVTLEFDPETAGSQ